MKIEKLPFGSYRIRKTYKGKTYTVIFNHKPTQKEAVQAMAAELDKVQRKHESMAGLLQVAPLGNLRAQAGRYHREHCIH